MVGDLHRLLHFNCLLLSSFPCRKQYYFGSCTDSCSLGYLFRITDLIFCIYLYQRWIYPVDKKRANEFGFAEEKPEIDADGNAIADDVKDTTDQAAVETKKDK